MAPEQEDQNRDPIICRRTHVATSLNPAFYNAWDHKRRAFRTVYESTVNDASRFECLLDYLYGDCVDGHLENDTINGNYIPFLPSDGNLDTGDPLPNPFRPMVEAFTIASQCLNDFSKYYGPKPSDALADVVGRYLIRCGLMSSRRAHSLDIAVGSGTVHLYDAVLRTLIRRPGDTVLAVAPSYGFFLSQPTRMGGHFKLLARRTEHQPRVEGSELEEAILLHQTMLRKQWQSQIDSHIAVFLNVSCCNFRNQPSSAARHELRDRLESICLAERPSKVDQIIELWLLREVFNGDRAALSISLHRAGALALSPPRVVAYLHINPDVCGFLYTPNDVLEVARVLRRYEVACIEDLSFLNLTVTPDAPNTSVQNYCRSAYTMLGLSKPFAVANLRVGVMAARPSLLRPVHRIIENSVGYVSGFLQSAVTAALDPIHDQQRINYLSKNQEIYRQRRALMLCALEGEFTNRVTDSQRSQCRVRLRVLAHAFFRRKRKLGVDLFNPSEIGGHDPAVFQHRAVESFVSEGMQRWFRVCACGPAGFYVIVDSSPLIDSSERVGIELMSAIDVASLLFEVFGVRIIPEEAMGCSEGYRPTWLRLSFAAEEQVIVDALFTLYLGLPQLLSMRRGVGSESKSM